MQLTAQVSTLIAATIASALGALVAYITLVINKENKISEFRQVWIDALREDLAKFFAGARTMLRSTEQKRHMIATADQETVSDYSTDLLGSVRTGSAEAISRIKLRLNPQKSEHVELERLLKVSTDHVNEFLRKHDGQSEEAFASVERATDYARTVLKTEWERVKAGEDAYNQAKSAMRGVLLVTLFLFIAVVVVVFRGIVAG